MALSVIGPQSVKWLQFDGMVTNAAGINVPTWKEAVEVSGSFQPVSGTLVQQLGLDMTKSYANFFASRVFNDVDRDKTGDRLIYGGRTYQVLSKTPWADQDGWEYTLCVEVTNAAA